MVTLLRSEQKLLAFDLADLDELLSCTMEGGKRWNDPDIQVRHRGHYWCPGS